MAETQLFSFRLPKWLKEKASEKARSKGLNLAVVIRRLLIDWVATTGDDEQSED